VRANTSSTWLVVGLGLFTIATLIWLLIPLFSDRGAAAQIAVPGGLFSRIAPDYGSDNLGDVFRTLRLTIVRELTGDEMELELLRPVPTATWGNFSGAAPFTATPTNTSTPTSTATPTETATPTSTATPRPTNTLTPTKKPTDKPKPPTHTPTITLTPSVTPTPTPADVVAPIILSGNPSPSPGPTPLASCNPAIAVTDLHITDDKPSYGMSSVKLNYEIPGFTSGFVFSDEMSLSSGGEKDGGWDAHYQGSIVFEIQTGWSPTEDFTVELYARVIDKGSHTTNLHLGTYKMMQSCAD